MIMIEKLTAQASEALAIGETLLARAFAIVSGAPYWKFIVSPEWAKLSIKEDTATLKWPPGYEDRYGIETESISFPANLLFISDAELASWNAEQKRLYDIKEQERQSAAMQSRQTQELATLAALKAKYETCDPKP